MQLPKQNLTLNETPELTEVQQQTLRAAVNRSIPPDDYPGALEAGVGHYLARQFEGDLARSFNSTLTASMGWEHTQCSIC